MEPLKKQVGNLTLDVENRRVMRGSKEIAVTRQMLAKDVWREPHRATPLDNVIDVHVSHLRRKIDEVQFLHTGCSSRSTKSTPRTVRRSFTRWYDVIFM
jgi:DNA-binding response OmpR family regulator